MKYLKVEEIAFVARDKMDGWYGSYTDGCIFFFTFDAIRLVDMQKPDSGTSYPK